MIFSACLRSVMSRTAPKNHNSIFGFDRAEGNVCRELGAIFPPTEQFGLSNQMRRASVSIASNIAEGNGRSTKGEYVVFLGHARASNWELQTQLTIACNLGFCSKTAYEPVENLSAEVSRMLNALMNKLKG